MEFFEGLVSIVLFGLLVNELYKRWEKGREKRERGGSVDKDLPPSKPK